MYIPLIVGIFAFIALILLLILDRRKDLNAKGVAYISRLGLSSGASFFSGLSLHKMSG